MSIIDCSSLYNIDSNICFSVDKNEDFCFVNFDKKSSINITIEKDIFCKISFLCLEEFNGNINFNCLSNCSVEIYYADLANFDSKNHIRISLNESFSNARFHLASLTDKKTQKSFTVSVDHNAKNTFALVDNYGVVKNEGKLLFDGTSYIKKGMVKSITRQNAKIMVFDKESIGIAKPILKIDENDIEASHGAVVGKINDEHLFYLTSRGLSEEKAKVLITYGYLKPITNGFNDELKTIIEKKIEESM